MGSGKECDGDSIWMKNKIVENVGGKDGVLVCWVVVGLVNC